VILSNADEHIDPAVLSLLPNDHLECVVALPSMLITDLSIGDLTETEPVICFCLWCLSDNSVLPWRFPIYPVIAGVHYSYFLNDIKGIIHELQAFNHIEYSHGHWIDPVFIVVNAIQRSSRTAFETEHNVGAAF
jgi:hypothetical protein